MKILLVDDVDALRSLLRALLTMEPGYEVVGEASDGAAGIRAAKALRPDVVVMDLEMPGMGGLEATRQIVLEVPGADVVVYTSDDTPETGRDLAQAGAVARVTKGEVGRLIDVIGALRRPRPVPAARPGGTPIISIMSPYA